MQGKTQQKSSKGVPTKARNPQRKVRRAKNKAMQPERKLRHIMKRNTMREAFDWADKRGVLSVLRQLAPDYQKQLAQEGQPQSV